MINLSRECKSCGLELAFWEFHAIKNHKTGNQTLPTECKLCANARRMRYYYDNRETELAKDKHIYSELRAQVFEHYGNKCTCCGEREFAFLTLDHVNNDGAAHRRSFKGSRGTPGIRLFRWIIKNNYPSSIQILCWNCNCAKAFRGGCPHKFEKEV